MPPMILFRRVGAFRCTGTKKRRATRTVDCGNWRWPWRYVMPYAAEGSTFPESRHHVSFSNLIYNQQQWAPDRNTAYAQLNLFQEQDAVIAALMREFEEVASWPFAA